MSEPSELVILPSKRMFWSTGKRFLRWQVSWIFQDDRFKYTGGQQILCCRGHILICWPLWVCKRLQRKGSSFGGCKLLNCVCYFTNLGRNRISQFSHFFLIIQITLQKLSLSPCPQYHLHTNSIKYYQTYSPIMYKVCPDTQGYKESRVSSILKHLVYWKKYKHKLKLTFLWNML